MYIKCHGYFDTECSNRWYSVLFLFGRPELTSKTQKRMARIVEAYAPLRPENELLNETLRQTDMDAYRQSRLITQIRNIHCMRRTAQSTLNQVRRLLRAF